MELRLPAPSLFVLVGPSGSGKTTWAQDHFRPAEIVSSDRLRAQVGTGENDQRASPAAFEILERIVAERIGRRLTTVVDTLGFDAQRRAGWVRQAHEAGIPVHAIVFDTPGEYGIEKRRRIRPFKRIGIALLAANDGVVHQEAVVQLRGNGNSVRVGSHPELHRAALSQASELTPHVTTVFLRAARQEIFKARNVGQIEHRSALFHGTTP